MNLEMCRQILVTLSNTKNSSNSFICFRLGTFGQTGKPQRIWCYHHCNYALTPVHVSGSAAPQNVQTCMIIVYKRMLVLLTNFRDTSCSFVMGERKPRMLTAQCRDKRETEIRYVRKRVVIQIALKKAV